MLNNIPFVIRNNLILQKNGTSVHNAVVVKNY